MAYKLSNRSLSRLDGVDERLQEVVKLAIKYTNIDFGITQGLRTIEEQRELVAKGASQTMKSNHLSGKAIDVVAYIGPRISWEASLYDDIADAFKMAAEEVGVSIRWGAAWHINNITEFDGTMQDATTEYVELRRSQGRKPFLDYPHFELS